MSTRTITQQTTVNPMSDLTPVNALKRKFITDMELTDMASPSRKRYLFAVEKNMFRTLFSRPFFIKGC